MEAAARDVREAEARLDVFLETDPAVGRVRQAGVRLAYKRVLQDEYVECRRFRTRIATCYPRRRAEAPQCVPVLAHADLVYLVVSGT